METQVYKTEQRGYFPIKRGLDFIISFILLCFLLFPMLFIAFLVRITSKGPAIHWSKRVGRQNQIFLMPKFRTMVHDAPQVATHLLQNSQILVTPVGGFLRKTSLDELPQLWSSLLGDMSLVGPRPALFNQDDLISLRTEKGIHILRPGITGWAQINGRDDLPIPQKVALDFEYLTRCSLDLDVQILLKTVGKVLIREGVKH